MKPEIVWNEMLGEREAQAESMCWRIWRTGAYVLVFGALLLTFLSLVAPVPVDGPVFYSRTPPAPESALEVALRVRLESLLQTPPLTAAMCWRTHQVQRLGD